MNMTFKDKDPINPIFQMLSLESWKSNPFSWNVNTAKIFSYTISVSFVRPFLVLYMHKAMTDLTVHQITLPSVKTILATH